MTRTEQLKGEIRTSAQLGKVYVKGPKEGSRTIAIVEVLERGKGYDDIHNRYKGVKCSIGWYRGENREFGTIDEIHVKDIN